MSPTRLVWRILFSWLVWTSQRNCPAAPSVCVIAASAVESASAPGGQGGEHPPRSAERAAGRPDHAFAVEGDLSVVVGEHD